MVCIGVVNVDESKSEGAETSFAVCGGLLHDNVASGGAERSVGSAGNEDICAAVKNGFWCAFDEKSTSAFMIHQDRHHLAVTRELEGEETGDGAFVVIVNGTGASKVRKSRQSRGELLVRAANFLSQNFESGFGGFTNV